MDSEVMPRALPRSSSSSTPTAAQIVTSLKDSPVYVQPGSQGATPSTSSDISALLAQNDHIVVVVLAGKDGNLNTLAKSVSQGLGKDTIVAISNSDQTVAYAPSFPTGTADDLMERASNVSTNNIETLKTFIGNVHDYQAAHPETITSTGQPVNPFVPIAIGGASVGVALVAVLMIRSYQRRIHSKVKMNAPGDIRPLVGRLMDVRNHIQSRAMRDAIEDTCIYVEAYFKRFKSAGRERDVMMRDMRDKLETALAVAHQYTEVEQEPYAWTSYQSTLAQGEEAMKSLSDSILETIRQRNSLRLLDYEVNTKILEAEKLRFPKRDRKH